MTVPYYEQCDDCKRLAVVNPYENAAAPDYRSIFTLVSGRKLCWECIEKAVKAQGVIPERPREPEGQ